MIECIKPIIYIFADNSLLKNMFHMIHNKFLFFKQFWNHNPSNRLIIIYDSFLIINFPRNGGLDILDNRVCIDAMI